MLCVATTEVANVGGAGGSERIYVMVHEPQKPASQTEWQKVK